MTSDEVQGSKATADPAGIKADVIVVGAGLAGLAAAAQAAAAAM